MIETPQVALNGRKPGTVMVDGLDGASSTASHVGWCCRKHADAASATTADGRRTEGTEGKGGNGVGFAGTMKIEGEPDSSKDQPLMTTNTRINSDTARVVLARMITAANGGTMPDGFDIAVTDIGEAPPSSGDYADIERRSTLFIEIEADGRLTVDVGIATSWMMLPHPGFRFARTPGGELVLFGRYRGKPMWFWIEDGMLWCDLGSPLLSAYQENEALAAFDAEFAMLVAEAL
ncbi:hypothetical protein HZF05_02930 [Sphingomonas sp. CGMCC 1.13654]|uniref:Uncharacterized protein n=1 Tax=Sphingomonas chungangi TaxID=2683589 RepID=A0A838L1H9_9SPHN|nr:hypothetical protein [Sphingomonas chungangi]MBA2933044.1 hypothetical protein [Sphingomonas chungangi]MVW56664.1 hypothetical protein [Sphingomonas chungangi]